MTTDRKLPVTITISGPHNTGRTTMAILFAQWLQESGYRDVKVEDTEPLPLEAKETFSTRFAKNRERPIRIKVVTEEHK